MLELIYLSLASTLLPHVLTDPFKNDTEYIYRNSHHDSRQCNSKIIELQGLAIICSDVGSVRYRAYHYKSHKAKIDALANVSSYECDLVRWVISCAVKTGHFR